MSKNALIIAAGAVAVVLAGYGGARLGAASGETEPVAQAGRADLFPFLRPLGGDDGAAVQAAAGAEGVAAIASADLRRLFDYFLDGDPPPTVENAAARIEEELGQSRPPAAQLRSLLERYAQYRRAALPIESAAAGGATAQAARQRLDALQALRPRFFDADETRGLFGLEDALDRDMLARLEVMQDGSLTPQSRQQKLAALDAVLTPALRDARLARFGGPHPDPAGMSMPGAGGMGPGVLIGQSTE